MLRHVFAWFAMLVIAVANGAPGVVRTMGLAVSLPLLLALQATAQQVDATAEPAPLARGYRTRTLAGGWGHSWLHGWPGYGKAVSDIQYFGFYPQMGWFVTNWLELYGEGTVHLYYRPDVSILGGIVGFGGRHYFLRDRPWTPYYTLAGGMAWTSLEVPEVDRILEFPGGVGRRYQADHSPRAGADAGVPQPPHLQRRHSRREPRRQRRDGGRRCPLGAAVSRADRR